MSCFNGLYASLNLTTASMNSQRTLKYFLMFASIIIIIVICFIKYNRYIYKKNLDLIDKFQFWIIEYLAENTPDDKFNGIILEAFQDDEQMLQIYDWLNDNEQLNDFCNTMEDLMISTAKRPNAIFKSKIAWEKIIIFITTVCSKLPIPPIRTEIPLNHKNWYAFSITFPRILVFACYLYKYLFGDWHPKLRNFLIQIVPQYIISPFESMGYARDGANSIMMAVPYYGAKVFSMNFEKEKQTNHYKRLCQTLEGKVITEGSGFYADGGYKNHGSKLRGYGYKNNSFRDTILLKKLTGFGNIEMHKFITNILEHPTIPRHFGPLFNRTNSILSKSIGGSFGFFIIDSMKILSVKTKDSIICFYGQHPELCFYEADQLNYRYSQYWVMARHFYYKTTPPKLIDKFIHLYPGVIRQSEGPILLKSPEITTHIFMPEANSNAICCKNGNAVAMRNEYTIKQFNLNVIEMIIITELGLSAVLEIQQIQNIANSKIIMSINFGKIVNFGKTIPKLKIYNFQNNYSCVSIGDAELIEKIEDPDTKDELACLQCTPNENNLIGYSTSHTEMNLIDLTNENELNINKFNTVDKFEIEYKHNLLFLKNLNIQTASVSYFHIKPNTILTIDAWKIYNVLGQDIKPIPRTTVLKKDKYYHSTGNTRMYTTFSYRQDNMKEIFDN